MSDALREEILMFVRHEDVPLFLAVGWTEAGGALPGPHGEYSQLLLWSRDGECVIPDREGQQWTSQQEPNGSMK